MQQASARFNIRVSPREALGLPGAGGKRLLAAGAIRRSAIFEETSSCRLQARTMTGDGQFPSAEMDGRWKMVVMQSGGRLVGEM